MKLLKLRVRDIMGRQLLTARGGVQFEVFGIQVEAGASIDVLAVGGRFGIGFKDGELYVGGGFALLFGFDIYLRIKFW